MQYKAYLGSKNSPKVFVKFNGQCFVIFQFLKYILHIEIKIVEKLSKLIFSFVLAQSHLTVPVIIEN